MNPLVSFLLVWVLPIVIFWVLGQFLAKRLMKKMGGGTAGNPFMQFGKSNAKVYVESTTGITFNDVAGEDEAKEKGIAVKVGKFIMSANGKSLITKEERGFIKIVAEEESGVIVGAQMMCARATDMIGEFVTAVANNMTVSQLLKGSKSKGNRNCRKTWNVDFRVVIAAFFVYGVTVYNDYKQ
jgi:hypothetical protein